MLKRVLPVLCLLTCGFGQQVSNVPWVVQLSGQLTVTSTNNGPSCGGATNPTDSCSIEMNDLQAGVSNRYAMLVPFGTGSAWSVIFETTAKGDWSDTVTCGTITQASNPQSLWGCLNTAATKSRLRLSVLTGYSGINYAYFGAGATGPGLYGANGTLGDGRTNAITNGIFCQSYWSGNADQFCEMPVFNYLFNGVGWDRNRTLYNSNAVDPGITWTGSANRKCYITSAATTSCKGSTAILHTISINTIVASATIKLYDINAAGCTGTPASGANGVITLPGTITTDNPFTLTLDEEFNNGLCVVTSGATDIQVSYE